MKVFKLEGFQYGHTGWNDIYEIVVLAENEAQARQFCIGDPRWLDSSWAICKEITEPGVVAMVSASDA